MERVILVGSDDVLSGGRMAREAGAEAENGRLRKALDDISIVGLLSDEKDSPRSARMREIAEKALK